jgi:hypothetical protein
MAFASKEMSVIEDAGEKRVTEGHLAGSKKVLTSRWPARQRQCFYPRQYAQHIEAAAISQKIETTTGGLLLLDDILFIVVFTRGFLVWKTAGRPLGAFTSTRLCGRLTICIYIHRRGMGGIVSVIWDALTCFLKEELFRAQVSASMQWGHGRVGW